VSLFIADAHVRVKRFFADLVEQKYDLRIVSLDIVFPGANLSRG